MDSNKYSTEINIDLSLIGKSYGALENWIKKEEYKGWDPFDALNSKILKRITFNNRRIGQIWLQLFKRSPINFRPLLQVQKGYNPKGFALFLLAYLRKYQSFGGIEDLFTSQFFADWLCNHTSTGYHGACWGYNFDWPSRGGFIQAGIPTVVNTAFIGLSLIELIRQLKRENRPYDNYFRVVQSICEFILKDLNQKVEKNGTICFSYSPHDCNQVHNANLLAAQLLAEVSIETNQNMLGEISFLTAQYSAERQLLDGSWWYGEGKRYHWIDNFHTGFVLVSLHRIGVSLRTNEFNNTIVNGYNFWKEYLFVDEYIPKYYPTCQYPIDIHCVAQAILTFLAFMDMDLESLLLAQKTAAWAVKCLQCEQGYYYYQQTRFYKNKIPYMRWSQAWMLRSLAELLFVNNSLFSPREITREV